MGNLYFQINIWWGVELGEDLWGGNFMKKQRGLKRYYRNLVIQNDFKNKTWKVNFDDPTAWFDNWHWHFDRKGFGNDSFKRRKPYLNKLFRHFDFLAEKTKK